MSIFDSREFSCDWLKQYVLLIFIFVLFKKTLNPSNLKITHHTAKQFISIDSLRSAQDSESIYQVDKINKKVDKKIYLTIGMNAVLNPQIYDNQTFMQVREYA